MASITLEDIKTMKSAIITPAIAASVSEWDAHNLRLTARLRPDWLNFPVILTGKEGHTVKIPRLPFIQAMELNKNVMTALLESWDTLEPYIISTLKTRGYQITRDCGASRPA